MQYIRTNDPNEFVTITYQLMNNMNQSLDSEHRKDVTAQMVDFFLLNKQTFFSTKIASIFFWKLLDAYFLHGWTVVAQFVEVLYEKDVMDYVDDYYIDNNIEND